MSIETKDLHINYYTNSLLINPNREGLDIDIATSFFDGYHEMDADEFLSKIDGITELSFNAIAKVSSDSDITNSEVMTLLSDNLKTEMKIALNSEFETKTDDIESFGFTVNGVEFDITIVKDIDPDKLGVNDVALLHSDTLNIYIDNGEGLKDSNKKIEN